MSRSTFSDVEKSDVHFNGTGFNNTDTHENQRIFHRFALSYASTTISFCGVLFLDIMLLSLQGVPQITVESRFYWEVSLATDDEPFRRTFSRIVFSIDLCHDSFLSLRCLVSNDVFRFKCPLIPTI